MAILAIYDAILNQSEHVHLCNHWSNYANFLYSHDVSVWFRGDTAVRNEILITARG